MHLGGCVEVEAAYYGAPPGWLRQRVQVQWNDLNVRLSAPQTGQILREHLRAPRGWLRIHEADRPARTPASTVALLGRAATAGTHISTVCQHICKARLEPFGYICIPLQNVSTKAVDWGGLA